MKSLIVAAAATAAVLMAAGASASPRPQQEPSYADARSTASDDEVRVARRAYRAACQQTQTDDYCECMTGGMAQALAPDDLAIATAAFNGRTTDAPQAARARVAAVQAQVEPGCAQYRR
jgi:hypothetical protein